MILSNVDIHAALDSGAIKIVPEPTPRIVTLDEPKSPYASTSVDLCLSSAISTPKEVEGMELDLRSLQVAPALTVLFDNKEIDAEQGYLLQPGKFILGKTVERIELGVGQDEVFAARVEGKSSRARMGLLVHFTAPTIHAGFQGTITLEIINLGPHPLRLYPNIPICQLIFECVKSKPHQFAYSQFQGQDAPVGVQN